MNYKMFNFGENAEGFEVPVLNEREIRAAAGILFVLMFISVMLALLKADFLLLKYSITAFFADISSRVFINPQFSPSLITGRLIVRNQTPEYTGAAQKKFAWSIGIILSGTAFILIVLMNTYSPVTGIICLTCLLFLFFESAFGICIGCKIYKLIYKDKAKYCPGSVCESESIIKKPRLSKIQYLVLGGFIVIMTIFIILFNNIFKIKPHSLFS